MEKNSKKAVIVSMVSIKGGSGKSTLVGGIAGFLAGMGKKVLMVDADNQPSISNFYGLSKKALNDNGLNELLKSIALPIDCISFTVWENLHVIQSNSTNSSIVLWLQEQNSNVLKLKNKLAELRSEYDYIIVDSPGNYNKLTEAVSIAGDIIITPVEPSQLSASELKRSTINMIAEASIFRQLDMPSIKLFINKKNNSNGSRDNIEKIRALTYEKFDLNITCMDSEIPTLACYADASSKQTPVHLNDKRAKIQLALLSKEFFPDLVSEIDTFMDGKAI